MNPAYQWACLACDASNSASAARCTACGCPSHATSKDIEAHRPAPPPADAALEQARLARQRHDIAAAVRASHFKGFVAASAGLYVVSFMAPDGSGLALLGFGLLALVGRMSPAWLANPLFIVGVALVLRATDPWRYRWLIYGAVALALTALPVVQLLPVPAASFFALWMLSPVVLAIGLHRYKKAMRAAPR
jgi:hypothetical protein